jgi:acetyltransferase-like isoleucine patch superfamily enzyme
MKRFIKLIVQSLNKLLIALNTRAIPRRSNSFFLFRGHCSQGNFLIIRNTRFEHTHLLVSDRNNTVQINGAYIKRSSFTISGSNNSLVIESGVILRDTVVIIRGNGCLVHIGRSSNFGGVRIVNVGNDNQLQIGKDCLFSDHIEIWASDSHPIFDNSGQLINAEKPIHIGDRVWVGSRATILKGVTIGNGSIIGMGSMVVNDVPPNSISVGNPNRIIKEDYGYWQLHYKSSSD